MQKRRRLKAKCNNMVIDSKECKFVNDCNNYINSKCEYALLHNSKYIKLSNISIEVFNSLKSTADIDLLFKYEDVISQMQELIEVEAYSLGKSVSYKVGS